VTFAAQRHRGGGGHLPCSRCAARSGYRPRVAEMFGTRQTELEHSPSDLSLARDLRRVANMPDEAISNTIAVRMKQDRKEIKRILGHLPVVNGGRSERHDSYDMEARSHLPRYDVPQRAATPSAPGSRRGGAATPMSARHHTSRIAAPEAPRPMSARSRPATQRLSAAGDGIRPDEEDSLSAADERHLGRLAAIGIDPTGMTANDIVRLWYARGSNTSMKAMNQEAEKRLNVRPHTPRAFKGVLTQRAHQEMRHARDLPASDLHHHLDRWEVDTLADLCRSLKHHEMKSRGMCSEYTSCYTRQWKTNMPPRKKFVRKPV